MFKLRAQRNGDAAIGQIRILKWWITIKHFSSMSDALIWLGYDEED